MQRRNLERQLRRVILGEMKSAEIQQVAEREGFCSFSDLCESSLPETLRAIRLTETTLVDRLRACLSGHLELFELWFWADELYHISHNHMISYAPHSEELIGSALSAISIVANDRIFTRLDRTRIYLKHIVRCLERHRQLTSRDILATIFDGLPVVHLAHKREPQAASTSGHPAWSDTVILDRPFADGLDLYLDYNWLVALTIRTQALDDQLRSTEALRLEAATDTSLPDLSAPTAQTAAEHLPPPWMLDGRDEPPARHRTPLQHVPISPTTQPMQRSCAQPQHQGLKRRCFAPFAKLLSESDLLERCQRRAPNFRFDRYRPSYRLDRDGIGEIILDAPHIGPDERAYATKLFCIANRVPGCYLDGQRLNTIVAE